jgi:hypothetical protein
VNRNAKSVCAHHDFQKGGISLNTSLLLDGIKEVTSIILKGTEANLNASEIRKKY